MINRRIRLVVTAVGRAAIVALLGFAFEVVVLVTLALIRWAVALSAWVVGAAAHHRIVTVMLARMV